jgi:hypothetical protein
MEGKIAALEGEAEKASPVRQEPLPPAISAPLPAAGATGAVPPPSKGPALPEGMTAAFLPAPAVTPDIEIVYLPAVLRSATVKFSKASLDIFGEEKVALCNALSAGDGGGAGATKPEAGQRLPPRAKPVAAQPHANARFADLPADALSAKACAALRDEFADWLFRTCRLRIFESPAFKERSKPGESEAEFRARLMLKAREKRDELKAKLRERCDKELKTLGDQLERATRTLDREASEASSAKMRTALSIGSTVLGVLMSRKKASVTNLRRGLGSVGSAKSAARQSGDVERAEEKVAEIRRRIGDLNAELEAKIREAEGNLDPMTEELAVVEIKPFKKDIAVDEIGIVWLPHVREGAGGLRPAWQA